MKREGEGDDGSCLYMCSYAMAEALCVYVYVCGTEGGPHCYCYNPLLCSNASGQILMDGTLTGRGGDRNTDTDITTDTILVNRHNPITVNRDCPHGQQTQILLPSG